jgi:hypothetical protein
VVQIQRPTLDLVYLERWARELDVADQLHNVLSTEA